MRVDYATIADLQRAARRHRAEAIGRLISNAIAWLLTRKPRVAHAAGPHFAR
jgi:hypothetical protein